MAIRGIFFCFVLCCFIPDGIFSQSSARKKFAELSGPEKRWVLFHPFCALNVNRLTRAALAVVEEVKKNNLLDQYENGGKLDAFRHVFTMAFLSQKMPVRKLRKLGAAHEKGNYRGFKKGKLENGELPDSVSNEMDLRNNEIGFETGKANSRISIDSLKKIVIQKINRGECWMIRRSSKGIYLQCDGQEILAEEWKGRWNSPKCLVGTDVR